MTREELITHIIELAKPFTARGSDPLEAVVQILVLHGEQKGAVLQLSHRSEWRPMGEAPKDGSWVLVKVGRDYTPEQSCDVLRFRGGWWVDVHGGPGVTDKSLAAWQPLPEPPAEEEMEALKDG